MLTLTFATVLTVANAKLSVYVLSLTVLTATLSFNMLPCTLNVKGCNCNGKFLHVDTNVCNCFNGCKCKA